MAHELGHFEMHKDYPMHNDGNSLNWFHETLLKFKYGKQELEANEFAAELLMPEKTFIKKANSEPFSPKLLRELSIRFKSSITSVAYRCVEFDVFPICIFFISEGKVKYWKKSDSLKEWIEDRNKLAPPDDSVASEYIDANYSFVYSPEEAQQEIEKSTWFKDNSNDYISNDDFDSYEEQFYEYCIPMKEYNSLISIVWKD
jgi:Zn-dependent peptidase ImmA (M78 family)